MFLHATARISARLPHPAHREIRACATDIRQRPHMPKVRRTIPGIWSDPRACQPFSAVAPDNKRRSGSGFATGPNLLCQNHDHKNNLPRQ